MTMMEYEFSEYGRAAFIIVHDELSDRKLGIPDDEDRRGNFTQSQRASCQTSNDITCVNGVMQLSAKKMLNAAT